MATKKLKGLGRGLEALLGPTFNAGTAVADSGDEDDGTTGSTGAARSILPRR